MPTPVVSTYDLASPRRPGTDDFNGIAKEDEPGFEPDDRSMPNAAEWNFLDFLMLSMNRVLSFAKISVTGGTSPVVNGVSSVRAGFVTGSITVQRTGAGVVKLTWAANTFPVADVQPRAFLNGTSSGMIACSNITNGVQINTFDATGAAADRDFTVEFG